MGPYPNALGIKLKSISHTISSWANQNVGNIFEKKQKLVGRLAGIQKALENRSLCKHLLDLDHELSAELNTMFDKEEAF